MSYRYYSGAEGRFYCYQSQATVRCPNAIGDPPTREEWEGRRARLTFELGELGLDAFKLMSRAHRSLHGFENPNRPGHCAGCGDRLEKVGYATWVEAPIEQVDVNSATKEINRRFGTTHLRVPGSHRYWIKKSEAIAWAREESQIDRAAERETVPVIAPILPAERRLSLYLKVARKMRALGPNTRNVRHAAVEKAWEARAELRAPDATAPDI